MQFGYNYEEIYLIFKKYAKKIKYLNYKNILKLIYGLILKRKIIINGLNNGEIIEKIINEECNKKNIQKLKQIKMPLLITSVELHTGNIYCFCSEQTRKKLTDEIIYENNINVGQAVRASCSYPGVFSPCTYNEVELIDGGLRENIPWKETKVMGADKVISVVFEKELKERKSDNIVDIVCMAREILEHELLNHELQGADYLLKIKTKEISLLDMSKIDELYDIGYTTAKKYIEEIKIN